MSPPGIPIWRRPLAAVAATLLTTTGLVAVTASAAYAAPGCSVTYTKAWEGGNGFGANIAITNTGDAITNGWSLAFTFPNGQQVSNGWPVTFTQSGRSVTVASNADWNGSIATGATFTAGFNGTFSGTNVNPTAFTLNGTACSGGGRQHPADGEPDQPDQRPAVRRRCAASRSPRPPATPAARSARVEFRVDGNLVNTDTTAPYTFTRHRPRGRQPLRDGHRVRQRQPGAQHRQHGRAVHGRAARRSRRSSPPRRRSTSPSGGTGTSTHPAQRRAVGVGHGEPDPHREHGDHGQPDVGHADLVELADRRRR